jgi:hypothetical protein
LIQYDPSFIDNIGSCGFATLKGHELIVEGFIDACKEDAIVNEILSLQEKHKQVKDISDMHINRRTNSPINFPSNALCCDNFSNEDWRGFSLVHYHNGLWNHFDKNKHQTRSRFIQNERPT